MAQTAAVRETSAASLPGDVGAIPVVAGGDARGLQSAGKDNGVDVMGSIVGAD